MTTPSSDKRGPEGRISPRHVFEKRIQIRLQRGGQNLNLEGWTRNLSEGGSMRFVAHSLALEELVTLEIELPGAGKQTIPAQVTRTLGTQYGFRFTALSVEQRAQTQEALKELPAIPHHPRRR